MNDGKNGAIAKHLCCYLSTESNFQNKRLIVADVVVQANQGLFALG